VDRLQIFLEAAAGAPPERDGRHFRTWQRVSVGVQREVRGLAVRDFPTEDLDRAFTMVVYSACQPCYGRRPMEFTYDLGDPATMKDALRLIGRSLQGRMVQVAEMIPEARMKRRFLPVWHVDVLNVVKKKPRLLIELLAREATMLNTLIDLGTRRDLRTAKRFVKSTVAAARVMGVDSEVLEELVLRTGAEHLGDGGVFEDEDVFSPGSPDARVRGDENRDHRRADGRGQVADAGVVPDVHAGG
jgi:hypothetical protein